jgi:hypothetical protein
MKLCKNHDKKLLLFKITHSYGFECQNFEKNERFNMSPFFDFQKTFQNRLSDNF